MIRAANNTVRDHVRARARGVPHAERPADGALSERFRDGCDPRIALPMGSAEQAGTRRAGPLDRLGASRDVVTDVTRRSPGELAVMVTVVADGMPFACGTIHEL